MLYLLMVRLIWTVIETKIQSNISVYKQPLTFQYNMPLKKCKSSATSYYLSTFLHIQAVAPIALAIMSNLIINLWDITGDEEDKPKLLMTLSDYPDATSFVDIAATNAIVEGNLGEIFSGHMVDVISEWLCDCSGSDEWACELLSCSSCQTATVATPSRWTTAAPTWSTRSNSRGWRSAQ